MSSTHTWADRWSRRGILALALIPALILAGIVILVAAQSAPAIRELGLRHLLSTEFSGVYSTGRNQFGLAPALWGTALVSGLAMAIALPVSLALGILATELASAPVGRAIESALGVLSGIPPILYALMSVVFAELIMRPKFCAPELPMAEVSQLPGLTWWNSGMLPYQNSALLGGGMIALLVIPYMAPLILDALRNAPHALREASLGLGASHWYTFRRVVLPWALPSIIAAASLGLLKTIGDVLIAAWVIGFESGMPNPLWDVFERIATLTPTGCGLAGGVSEGTEAYNPMRLSVAYFTCLLLLLLAWGILSLAQYLQHRTRRKVG